MRKGHFRNIGRFLHPLTLRIDPPMRFRTLLDDLRSTYWFLPALLALASVLLAFGLVALDRRLPRNFADEVAWVYSGGPEGARGLLSAVAGSVISVAGTTFSITVAALSLASGQFGPRLLRNFMRDSGNQLVLGTFTSTYLYCLLVLRTVRGTENSTYVPHLSITVAVLLAMGCVGVLIYFIHHVAESIQVAHIVEAVGDELDRSIRRLSSPEGEAIESRSFPDARPETILAEKVGYVRATDFESILRVAQTHDLVVRVEHRPGSYVIPGMALLSVWPSVGESAHVLRRAVTIDRQRTVGQDAEYAFLELSEVAVRALSPGTNDPFTAIACIDRLTAALCLLARCRLPSPWRSDDRGQLRLFAPPYVYDRLVQAAFRPIRESLNGSAMVSERLRWGLDTVLAEASEPELRAALREERSRIPD